jgi:hypothetical protein
MCLACEVYGEIHGLAHHAKSDGPDKEKANSKKTNGPNTSSTEPRPVKKETATHAEE